MNQEYFIAKYTPLGIDLKLLIQHATMVRIGLDDCVCETVNSMVPDKLINYKLLHVDFENDNRLTIIDENVTNNSFTQI